MTGEGFRPEPVRVVIVPDPRVKQSYPNHTQLEKDESHLSYRCGERDAAGYAQGPVAEPPAGWRMNYWLPDLRHK